VADEIINTSGEETPEKSQTETPQANETAGAEQMPKFKSLAEKKKYIQELKKKKEKERKAQLKKDREEAKRKAREERKSNGGGDSKSGLWIALGALVVLVGSVGAYFTFNNSSTKHEKSVDPPVVVTVEDSASIKADTAKIEIEKVPVKEPEVKTGNKWGINAPCYVISHSSVKNETTAKKTVQKLVKANFKTGYYWIPDVTPGGNEFFKVYVGPFGSERAAIDKLYEVRKYSKLAYIVEIK